MKTTDLLGKFYKGRETPYTGQKALIGYVRELVNKTASGHEYRVLKSERGGPKPLEVWVERVKGRA